MPCQCYQCRCSLPLPDVMRAITPGSLSLGGLIPDQLVACMLSLLEPDISPVLQLVCLQVGGVMGRMIKKVCCSTPSRTAPLVAPTLPLCAAKRRVPRRLPRASRIWRRADSHPDAQSLALQQRRDARAVAGCSRFT